MPAVIHPTHGFIIQPSSRLLRRSSLAVVFAMLCAQLYVNHALTEIVIVSDELRNYDFPAGNYPQLISKTATRSVPLESTPSRKSGFAQTAMILAIKARQRPAQRGWYLITYGPDALLRDGNHQVFLRLDRPPPSTCLPL